MYKIIFKILSCFIPSKKLRTKLSDHYKKHYTPTILSRTACLGNFSYKYIDFKEYTVKNHMKNRVDYSVLINKNPEKIINIDEVLKYTSKENQHWKECYKDLAKDIFKYKNIRALIIDSWSELTDQLFTHKTTHKMFCNNYRTVEHTQEFENLYLCKGLIPIEEIEAKYDTFFKQIETNYGKIPILFLHFPTKFETREKFLSRAEMIKIAIERLSNKYNITSLTPDLVEQNPNDPIIYHFSNKTYETFAQKISEALQNNKINVSLIK